MDSIKGKLTSESVDLFSSGNTMQIAEGKKR